MELGYINVLSGGTWN